MKPIQNGLSFDIEDWFQVENLRGACPVDRWDSFELRVERNTETILELLANAGCKATFFILGWIAQRKPGLVRDIASQGHEIASHGYNHDIVYSLTPETFRKDLNDSKKLLEDITGQEVLGYRAPNFSITQESIWAVDILKESGFRYDSSIFPTSFHDRYGFKGITGSSFFKFKNGLLEFPLTIYRIGSVNVPVGGGGYFRLCPYPVFKFLLSRLNHSGKEFIFYLHPWEIDHKQPRMKLKLLYSVRHYLNLERTEGRLKHLLHDFQFQPLMRFLDTQVNT